MAESDTKPDGFEWRHPTEAELAAAVEELERLEQDMDEQVTVSPETWRIVFNV